MKSLNKFSKYRIGDTLFFKGFNDDNFYDEYNAIHHLYTIGKKYRISNIIDIGISSRCIVIIVSNDSYHTRFDMNEINNFFDTITQKRKRIINTL